jgi:hypothetical protein
LEIRHVWEKLRDVIRDRQRLVHIHEIVSLVLIADGEQYLLWERRLAGDVVKVATYSVHLTLGKSDGWTLEDERAIDHGNEDKCAKESRVSEIIICSLERVYFHRL